MCLNIDIMTIFRHVVYITVSFTTKWSLRNMDSILEAIFHFFIEAVKFIFYVIIWNIVFFYIGVTILKTLTFLKYPTGKQFEKHVNVISGVGLNFIFILWSLIATYNFSTNKYFLVTGLVIALFQALLIAMKYYSLNRNAYEL